MSNYLYLRKYKVLVGNAKTLIYETDQNGTEQTYEAALNVSDLRCTFRIKKSLDWRNFATITIYNLNDKTEKKIIEEGDRCIVEAGYEGYLNTDTAEDGETQIINENKTIPDQSAPKQYGKIFDGSVVYATRAKENNTDYTLTLICVDGDSFIHGNFIATTMIRGQNPRQVIETAVNMAKVPTETNRISPGLSGQTLPRGKVFFGRPIDILQDVARGNNANVWIEDGLVNVTKMTDECKTDAIVLTPQTGLIGFPQQIQYGVSFQALMNPAIEMMSLVQLKNVDVAGLKSTTAEQTPLDPEQIYQATEVEYVGDTRGNDWYVNVSGVSRAGKTMLLAMLQNYNQTPNSN